MGCTSSKGDRRARLRSAEQTALLRNILMSTREAQRCGDNRVERPVLPCVITISAASEAALVKPVQPRDARPSRLTVPFSAQLQSISSAPSALKPLGRDDEPLLSVRSPMQLSITTPLTCGGSSFRSSASKRVSFSDGVRFNDRTDAGSNAEGTAACTALFLDPILPSFVGTTGPHDSPGDPGLEMWCRDCAATAGAAHDGGGNDLTSSNSSESSNIGSPPEGGAVDRIGPPSLQIMAAL